MNIQEIADNLYEDLNGEITDVIHSDPLTIHFRCDNWDKHDEILSFVITCEGVIERNLHPSTSGEIAFLENHPLLWNHNEEQGRLFYSSTIKNSYEVLGKLLIVHEEALGGWRSLTDFVNLHTSENKLKFATGPSGLLASGPLPLLQSYQKATRDNCTTNYVPSFKPTTRYKALIFDDNFVICQSVAVNKSAFKCS